MNKLLLAGALAVAAYLALGPGAGPPSPSASGPAPSGAVRAVDGQGGDAAIEHAYAERLGNYWVEGQGRVAKRLADDNDGSRHQRFIVELASGRTLLVAHNIDLAPRIDALAVGDTVDFAGEYEWNPQGGVIHWTHHDPQGRRPGGWLRHRGRIYQ